MAYDKVVDSTALDRALTNIANAIRSKTGEGDKLTLDSMPDAIKGIQTGDTDAEDGIVQRTITGKYVNNRVVCIAEYAFRACFNITFVDAAKVTSINPQAFSYCSALTGLALRATKRCTLSNTNAFASTPIASGTGYIYVPDDLVEDYKSATNWSVYADQIRGLSELEEDA